MDERGVLKIEILNFPVNRCGGTRNSDGPGFSNGVPGGKDR
jgi:hypothetical protein